MDTQTDGQTGRQTGSGATGCQCTITENGWILPDLVLDRFES